MLDRALEKTFASPPQINARPAADPAILAAALRISPTQGRVLCMLLAKPLTMTREIEERYGMNAEGRRALIYKLRPKLSSHRVRILSHPGLGYSIPEEDRGRIFEIVDKFKGTLA